jgi:hypothetical protein
MAGNTGNINQRDTNPEEKLGKMKLSGVAATLIVWILK